MQIAEAVSKEAVFRARGLSKVYRLGEVEVYALRALDLDLYQGEFVVLLGPSGSGKSTLLNILGGLDAPTSGEVAFRDHNLTQADDRELTRFRREHVGFVFQFYTLIPSLTALENVQLVAEISEHPMAPEEAVRMVSLSERLHHFPAQLSGGEQQRVAIARAIAKRPDVLLCDEPTGALDFSTGKLVLEVLEHVNRELGTTTAVITHNAAIAAMADRVIRVGRAMLNDLHIKRGRYIEPGQRDEVLISSAFSEKNKLNPGDTISAIINGRWTKLSIVGVALSPEFIYEIRPGEMFPDARRFGVLWMNRDALGIEEQRVNVIADFVESFAQLGDGYRVEAKLVIWEAENVVKIPASALFRQGQNGSVFVIANGQAKLRPLDIGHRNAFEAEVMRGWQEGEQVILHPASEITDGLLVRAK